MKAPSRKPSVKLVHGQAITTSIKVAEYFGKEHYRVIRAIENLECSPEFRAANFGGCDYVGENGKTLPMYTITKDGFMFLAMGFTGKEAAQWKEKYIAAFNELERRALDKAAAKRLPKPAAPKPVLSKVEGALPPPPKAPPAGIYHYPRNMLNQPYFVSPKTGQTLLNVAVLTSSTYVSPLMALLNQMRSEGHEVTAPFDEALAMRKALSKAARALDDIQTQALAARYKSAE